MYSWDSFYSKAMKIIWRIKSCYSLSRKYYVNTNVQNLIYIRGNNYECSSLLSTQNLRYIAASSSSLTVATNEKNVRKFDPLDTRFSDPEVAFKSKTTKEVLRAFIVYQLCSINFLVENNVKLMKLSKTILGNTIFTALMRATFYGHFVAGKDEQEILPVLKRLSSFGVNPILDFSAEEDFSHEEAEKLEMEATLSEVEKKGQHLETDEIGGDMPQYHANKSFADRRYKVTGARTYFYLNEPTCERNFEIFQKSLHSIASNTDGSGITAVKLTALGRPQLLLQLSEVIMRARNFVNQVMGGRGAVLSHNFTADMLEKKLKEAGIVDTTKFLEKVVTDKEGVIHLFPWSGIVNENFELSDTFRIPSLKEGRMVRLISQLSQQEEAMFRNMIQRVNTLVKTAKDLNVCFMIDAEQAYFQPAISRITLEMMNKYNRDKTVVFNTYQCYLKESFNEIFTDLEQAKRQNFYFGAKLVRGAYMDQERERAAALQYPDPINPTFEATSDMYHQTFTECLRRIKALKMSNQPKKIAIMVATHNEDTVRFAIDKMKEMGIAPEDKVISFGQLYGMCDYITFPLGQAGYCAYKYVPYGPVDDVLPYLSRRATENKSVMKKLKKEKKLLLKELIRRITKGQIFYTPVGDYIPVSKD